MRNLGILLIASVVLTGCDAMYQYIVFPPTRVEYVLSPDSVLTRKFLDKTLYKISEDRKGISFDRKDFKVEIKYMSDYQLNTFEFPDQSTNGYYSTNPFTFGNWVDPELGFVPNRFTVFKVTIYNYSASKVNFDPENAILESERGDKFYCYGREEKSSKYQSLEEYFKKRKGTSGVDEDVFESRMGIIRRTVHYLGKPVFRNDVRDGLIVFDPLPEDAGKVKLTLKDFILGYDENNQPSEFTDLSFYFDRTEFEVSGMDGKDSTMRRQNVKIVSPDAMPGGTAPMAVWKVSNIPLEKLMGPLQEYLSKNTNLKTPMTPTDLSSNSLKDAKVLLLLTGDEQFTYLPEHEKALADFFRSGGFIVADVFATSESNRNWSYVNNYIANVNEILGGKLNFARIPSDHVLYKVWKSFDMLPTVDIDLFQMQQKSEVDTREKMFDFLMGLYYENKLIGVFSNRGYSIAWGEFYADEFRNGKDYTRQRELISNIIYYATQIQKNEK